MCRVQISVTWKEKRKEKEKDKRSLNKYFAPIRPLAHDLRKDENEEQIKVISPRGGRGKRKEDEEEMWEESQVLTLTIDDMCMETSSPGLCLAMLDPKTLLSIKELASG